MKADIDEKGYNREYPYYTAEVVEIVKNSPGSWDSVRVAVLEHPSREEKHPLGEPYRRNYSTLMKTFFHFRKGDRHFALYSRDYTATRVMEIFPGQGWKDLGGEEPDTFGFCPVEYYVPTIRKYIQEDQAHPAAQIKDWDRVLDSFPPGSRFVSLGYRNKRQQLRYPDGKAIRAFRKRNDAYGERVLGPTKTYESGWLVYPPQFGFVSGCIWGDDNDWKIQLLDLSQVEQGIVTRNEERLGHLFLPKSLSLSDAITTDSLYDPDRPRVEIATPLVFDLTTGNALIEDETFWDKLVCGREQSQLEEEEFRRENAKRHAAGDQVRAELKQRWQEQADAITKEVVELGGQIG